MKDFWKRSLAFVLAFLMVFGLLPVAGWKEPVVKTALAAEGDPFTLKEFQTCYGKVLLSMVGRGYDAGGSASGYWVGGTYYSGQTQRVTSGTPYHPLAINGNTNDCYGLVITALMAMGYDYFYDDHGHTYPFNAYYGGGIFDPNTSSNSIFRYNGTGDILHLHHSNNQKYTIHFEIGEIINKGSDWGGKDEEVAGSLIFSLTSGVGNPTTPGPFSAGAIKNINHAAVGLFYQKRAASDSMPQDASYALSHQTEAEQVLIKSYDTAYAKIQSLYGVSLGKGSKRPGASYWTPFLWDARGRGFGVATDSGDDGWKKGFQDGTNPHFNTPYNTVWQVEAIGNTGVSVNNNPFGKTMFTPSIEVKPINPAGDITINKTEDGTGTPLSGATFTLYEWSKASGSWKASAKYKIAEQSAGVYTVYNKSTGDKDVIEINEDNMGRVRVEETTAPKGFNNKDASNNTLAWEHTFPTDVFTTQSWTIDAVNQPLKVGFVVYKHLDTNTSTPISGATFRLYSNEACTTLVNDATNTSSFTTNASGKFNLKFNLKSAAQTFYFKEYTAPTGYQVNGDTFRISIAGAATGTITVDRKPSGGSWTNVTTVSYDNAIALTNGQANVPETPIPGNLVITKTLEGTKAGTFWFKITGPEYPSGKWESLTFAAGDPPKSITLNGIKAGAYTVTEVKGNGSNEAVASSDAFPFGFDFESNRSSAAVENGRGSNSSC